MDRIGRYEIQALLGRGGFGQVYRAFDPTVGRLVAIKTLTAAGDPDLLRRFRNEAAAAGKLRHNNIVIIYDFGEHDGFPYLVMELLDGEDLERIIANRRPLTLLQKLDVISQSASALHHAHAQGIVHRDVKPANIMLRQDGVVKIMDFGIALLTQATAARMTPEGSTIGTFPYMAPEQFSGRASDALTDIFAFGVTCYKLLTGTHPFHAEEMGALMFNIMNKAPEPLRSLSPECPEALEQAVFKLLAKDRDQRYQSLDDLRLDIGPVVLDLRQEHVNDLIASAQEHIASNRLDEAQAALREVLQDDPANRTARDLRESLHRQIRENEIRPRVAALVKAGREHLEARRFEDAIKSFESALQIDKSNPELHQRIADARTAWEKAQRAARLLDDAHRSLNRGDLTAARHIVHEALSLEPQNAEAGELSESIEEQFDVRERERRLEEGITHARRLLLVESYEEAITQLEQLSAEFPESTAARELLARARTELDRQQRRQRLQAAIDESKRLLKNGRFEEALEKLTASRTEFPESAELRDLASFAADEVASQRQAAAIGKAAADARSLIDAGNYDSALELLERAISEYPAAATLRELVQTAMSGKADYSRRTNLKQTVADAKELLAKERHRETAERIAAFVRAYGDAAELEPLRKQAEEGLEKQRQLFAVRKLMLDARSFLDENRPSEATRILQSGTTQFPNDPELARLLNEAERRLREDREREAISKIISEAESLARAQKFDRALSIVDRGLEQYAGTERLLRCRQAIVAGEVRHQRDRAQREALARIRSLRQQGKLEEALAAIDATLQEFGDETGLLDLRRQIAVDQVAQEHSAEIDSILRNAQRLIGDGHAASAVEVLSAAVARFPEDERLADLKRAAEERAEEIRRAEQIAGILRDARAQYDGGNIDRSLAILEEGLRQHEANADLLRAREGVAAEKAKRAQQKAREELIANVRALHNKGEFDKALTRLVDGLTTFAGDPELLRMRTQIEADRQRRHTIAAAVREAEQMARAGKYAEALAAVESGLSQYPGADDLVRLRDTIHTERLRAQALAEAQRLQQDGALDAALGVIAHALESAPADAKLRELKARIEADRERRRQSEAIEAVLRDASALVESGRTEEAVKLLRPATAQYPEDGRLSRMLRSAEEDLQRSEQEQAAITAARAQLLGIEQAIASTRGSRLAALVREARRVAARHEDNPELAAIAMRIERQVKAVVTAPVPPRRPLPWRWIGIGVGALAIVAIALGILRPWSQQRETVQPQEHPSVFAVDIRTDPAGAAVSVAGRTCTPPNCQFSLPAGQYTVSARLKGYKVAERTLIVDPQHPPGITSVTLEPEPPPTLPVGSQAGTLLVRAGVEDARVLVDGIPRGLTDSSGRFHTNLEPGVHNVRVEKAGYRTTPNQGISITAGKTREFAVSLAANPARLQIRGAPAGIEVRAGAQSRRTDGSALFAMDVDPHSNRFQITEGQASWDIARVFGPGGTVTVDWSDIAKGRPAAPAPAPPPHITPSREDSEWERVRKTSDADQIEAYVREFRNGAHAEDAEALLDKILWARTNQSDARSLKAYVARMPHGPHSAEAQRLADDLEWKSVNRNSVESVQAFLEANGSSRHRAEAQALLDRLKSEGQAAAEHRTAIRAALQRFNDAFVHKSPRELKEIWPGALPDWMHSMNQRGAYFVATLYPSGEPQVKGTRATIACELITQTIIRGQPQPQNRKTVKVTLRRSGDAWVIEDPRGTE